MSKKKLSQQERLEARDRKDREYAELEKTRPQTKEEVLNKVEFLETRLHMEPLTESVIFEVFAIFWTF